MSDNQLEDANLPPRPTDTDDPNYATKVATWTSFVTNPIKSWSCADITTNTGPSTSAAVFAASSALANGSLIGTPASPNWAGFQATSGEIVHQAEATWVTPWTLTDDNHPYAHESFWVGVGDGTSESNPLVQAGTHNRGSTSFYWQPVIWWEVFCTCPGGNAEQVIAGAASGDVIYVKAQAFGTTDSMTVTDQTTGYSTTFTYNKMTQNFTGNHAEWISERPSFSNAFTQLAKTVVLPNDYKTFSGARAKIPSQTTFKPISFFDRYRIHMTNCQNTQTLEDTSALNTAGDSFSTTWKAYGISESC